MDYYHIKIKIGFDKGKSFYRYDMMYDEVLEMVDRYKSGDTFYLDGYSLNQRNIIQFKISVTEKKKDIVLSDIRASWRSSGFAIALSDSSIIENNNYSKDVTGDFLNPQVKRLKDSIDSTSTDGTSKNVFIVHGHNTNMIEKVELLLTKLGYNPIVLFKEADKGKTIIEKIEENSDKVCFAIVLYSKCDIGYPAGKEDDKKYRARQNVVFEHGYMMAKLGREKVCALLEDSSIERPGDIDGIIYVTFGDNNEWKLRIAKNMKAIGLAIDYNSLYD